MIHDFVIDRRFENLGLGRLLDHAVCACNRLADHQLPATGQRIR
jgi:hypothetical protein